MARKIPVLLVDESTVCEQVKSLFEGSRFEVYCYNTAGEAKQNINASRFQIAVVSLDATTDDGMSLIEVLIDHIPNVRCIAVVENPDVASVQRAMKLGCKSYLAKPAAAETIFRAVGDVAQSTGLLTLSERELQLRLSRLLRAQRLKQELTLTEMAQRVGLSKAQLSQIELAKSWPSFPTLKRISEELDQPFSQLFKAVEQV